ncbi:cyclic peptide export ABC transporter [Pseudoalteromonas luteoviolacea]|uniref:Cyclic peptide transporter n=1 Tax=Pseudoalteromonas luteoviolacea S4054 TaxID=1129367 RepID=A0A0F6AEB7_9GAMM|nr:cyclic peptide export ABC transporter [Pseudoalteromonas luteoviolacea]AOT10635.1 hypothetical protein S4054249_22505 [Pseudoalteromonas luteoviolacea]AOT15297.1 hypothetical protein S40542_21090 [Pseudoalteromonas luteoviolacea]AOT20454.1 hypothetical protein S4054_22420 [Pseudoalteromonas luteoviolacea]KKE83734.1 hypothetical protein N479_12975 [Pseudoalteromonas luteoviolacea S4054]KZN71938.1 hypothetical protein N481_17340 [Pseudoalteromonas luteoviolacea S4047-1]
MQLKKISDLYWNCSPNSFYFSVLLGIFTGLCYAMLIPFIMYAMSSNNAESLQLTVEDYFYFSSPTSQLAIFFLVAISAIIVIRTTSLVFSTFLAKRASVKHRISLYHRIQNLPYAELEKIGQARLINLLNVDIPHITTAATTLPVIWSNAITIVGTLGYLIYLDIRIFLFVTVSLLLAMLTYQLPLILGTRLYAESREHYDEIQEGVKSLILGAKELKLNQSRSDEFFEQSLMKPERKALKSVIKGYSVFCFGENYGGIVCFLVIGVVLFHLPYRFEISQAELFSIIMALLYLTGPAGQILSSMNLVRQGQVSLAKVKKFYTELSEEPVGKDEKMDTPWKQLEVSDLSYAYSSAPDSFALNKVNLTFRRGEVNFIVGGNGSGKSTLSKCLSLHYLPTEGYLSFDQQQINDDNRRDARQFVSAIYSDYHLFSDFYGIEVKDSSQQQKVLSYLRYLELDEKVKIEDGRLSTTRLSDGQRRRLALLVLLLEDRDICMFDEWAADQDPRFKHIFYSKILQDLKQQGKVIIVVSHDDRYFEFADQLIFMESGHVDRVVHQPDANQRQLSASKTVDHKPELTGSV